MKIITSNKIMDTIDEFIDQANRMSVDIEEIRLSQEEWDLFHQNRQFQMFNQTDELVYRVNRNCEYRGIKIHKKEEPIMEEALIDPTILEQSTDVNAGG